LTGYERDELELFDTKRFWHDLDQRAAIIASESGFGTGWHRAPAARAEIDRMSGDERKAAANALRRALGLLETDNEA